MSKVLTAQLVKIVVPAGKATPTPPVGPALGARGVKAMDFCKEFNAKTSEYIQSIPIPTLIKISPDRTFTFQIRTPPVSYLIKKTLNGDINNEKKQITLKHIYEIAKIKSLDQDLNSLGLKRISKSIIGTAKSLGVEVVP
ncbi:mitochondrial 54S ribosomal protein uL11m [Kwoniella pini CBS 10737]|uniref:Large ribosomal subunit protein uL11m n=1 Tax=Kwoniella pini CBS 10737 TaxID=1296096 RepID=A0A1B9I077_9TREE|nr:ribosomal protein L11 [Kwoniella pini CBS 10737]OCF48915.1 ribosomal protein L11 [Kwoniella pini CBS 10737]